MIHAAMQHAMRSPLQSAMDRMGSAAFTVNPPVGFPSVPFGASFYKSGASFTTDYSPSSPISEGGAGVTTYFVDKATGLDTNPGTEAQPYKTIYKAITNGRGVAPKMLIKVKGGVYYLPENFNNKIPEATTLSCVSWDGNPVICSHEVTGLVWTLDSSNTYYAPVVGYGYADYRSTAWDGSTPDTWGDFAPLIPAASVAACKATAGTYYTDQPTGRIYVHTSDNRVPDSDIHVFEAWGNPGQYRDYPAGPANGACYFENFHFHGGASSFTLEQTHATNTTAGIFKSCSFKYAAVTRSAYCAGNLDVAFVSCVASANHADGFSYESYGANPAPRAIEIGCEARTNGIILTGTANQGSTMHNGGTIVRLNGNYHHNENDQIADVNTGTKSWLINCSATNGLKANYSGFLAGNGSGAVDMWLETCRASGCTYDINSGTSSTVYTKDFSAGATNTGTGTITTY